MTSAVQDLYEKATELSPEERAALAALLLESLEGTPDEGAEEAWAGEIDRRMADYRAGRVKTIAWQEVRARLHRRDR
jgi:putative addiction module component (TIGR02574 family)